MSVKEIIEENMEKVVDFEVYQYTDRMQKLHCDYIKNIDGEFSRVVYEELEAQDYRIMDEKEYSETVLGGHEQADFAEWYDDKNAKVLVIMLAWDADLDAM